MMMWRDLSPSAISSALRSITIWGGVFHVERRLGCIGCPLATDNGRSDFRKYPQLLRMVIKSAQKYLDSHPTARAYEAFGGDAYNLVYKRLFCKTMEEYTVHVTGGIFPEMAINPRQVIEEYFFNT